MHRPVGGQTVFANLTAHARTTERVVAVFKHKKRHDPGNGHVLFFYFTLHHNEGNSHNQYVLVTPSHIF